MSVYARMCGEDDVNVNVEESIRLIAAIAAWRVEVCAAMGRREW